MKSIHFLLLLVSVLNCWKTPLQANSIPAQLVSTETDPDAFIQHCVNVINGDYCESCTDLVVAGPDTLLLQRFYNAKNYITGASPGSWRIFPQRFLVIGKDPKTRDEQNGGENLLAFTGERSGGILPYSGWRTSIKEVKDPLKIDVWNQALGMVNTFAKEMSGQNNHRNNRLYYGDKRCELLLGDGSKRIYNKVKKLPDTIFGEELTPAMIRQVNAPECYLLDQEILPSGNQMHFSYDHAGHLTSIEMKNASNKLLSWIRLTYNFNHATCFVHVESSDTKTITYCFELKNDSYQLVTIKGSHLIPVSYVYRAALVKKILPEGRFVEIEYQNEKVKTLKGPNALSGKAEVVSSFSYQDGFTEVADVFEIKTRYYYDKRLQLIAIERYDSENHLYRAERKHWGTTPLDAGLLLAKSIEDGNQQIHSYRSFKYDSFGNVIEEKLYGNLTGKEETLSKKIDCHTKKFAYSADGFNLLMRSGDGDENQTRYIYKPGTNLLIKKLIYDRGRIKKRTFHSYNEDAVCIKTIEDDGSQEDEYSYRDLTERHIKEIQPKQALPGMGMPEVIEEKALDLKKQQEVLIKKLVNIYDDEANLITCYKYGGNNQLALTEQRTYNSLGLVESFIDSAGRETFYTYDGLGNQTSNSKPLQNKTNITLYNFHNNPIEITEITPEGQCTQRSCYDALGRKTCSTDSNGHETSYDYDAFNHLIKVTHPEVLNEHERIVQPVFKYSYDLFGNAITIQDPAGYITSRQYNLYGKPVGINYPDGSNEHFIYHLDGSLHHSISRDKIKTSYQYDYLGRVIREEKAGIDSKGTVNSFSITSRTYNGFRCSQEQINKHIKLYDYHPSGQLASCIQHAQGKKPKDPESRMTEFLYDPLGRLSQKKIWFDIGPQDYSLEHFTYDLLSNITEKRVEDAQGNVLFREESVYNLQGQCVEESHFENGVKIPHFKTAYNVDGEPINYLDGLHQETKVVIDKTHLNALGQTVLKKTLINSLGVYVEIEYDALSRVHLISKKDPSGRPLSSQKILYDALGNKSCEIHDQIVDGQRLNTQTTRWIYGPMGRLETEIEAAGSSLEKQTHYSYNSLGQVVQKMDSGAAFPINYTYHRFGWLHKVEAQSTTPDLQVSNRYWSDHQGNITSADFGSGNHVTRNFNIFNQVTRETVSDAKNGSYTLEYAYDRRGRIKTIILPDKSKISYLYDALFGREAKRISAQGELLYTHTYDAYDEQGRLLQETRIGNTGTQEYTYDANGHRRSVKNAIFSEEYERDPLGRLLEIKGEEPAAYSYNDLSQLISEKKEDVKTYAYDSLDNRIKVNQDELTYNALNQLTSHLKESDRLSYFLSFFLPTTPTASFSYDPQGNLLRKILNGEETKFKSNSLNQLIAVETADKRCISFSYDPFGRLVVEKQENLNSHETLSKSLHFYIGHQEIGSLNGSGKITALKIPGLQGEKLSSTCIAFEIDGNVYAPLHDICGNVTRLIDPESRETVEKYHYSSFGEETIYDSSGKVVESSSVSNPWRFAEKRIQPETGLILFGFRFYDPAASRWISQDPAGFVDGPNLYAYVHNDPINHKDCFGLYSYRIYSPGAHVNGVYVEATYVDGQYFLDLEDDKYYVLTGVGLPNGTKTSETNASLPKISYCEAFENLYSEWEPSKIMDLSDSGAPELSEDLEIGFINGVLNMEEDARESMRHISRLAGGCNVHAVYNATHGYYSRAHGTSPDFFESHIGLLYKATEPVHQLHKMWNNFFNRASDKAKYLMICHSQGAIHVRNALLDYPPQLRERIMVVAIAPAAYIYQETCAQVIHYRAEWWRDLVPRFDIFGTIREKDSVITLNSHPNAATFDHAFTSPTYQEKVQHHIKRYIKSQGKIL